MNPQTPKPELLSFQCHHCNGEGGAEAAASSTNYFWKKCDHCKGTGGLKDCPFCAVSPDIEPWHGGGPLKRAISCVNDDCPVQPGVTGETAREAAERWNRRAPATEPAAAGEAGPVCPNCDSPDISLECQKCGATFTKADTHPPAAQTFPADLADEGAERAGSSEEEEVKLFETKFGECPRADYYSMTIWAGQKQGWLAARKPRTINEGATS